MDGWTVISKQFSLAMLPTLADRPRQAMPKAGLPTPIAKQARAKSKKEREVAFREAIWARDKGRCRATRRQLVHWSTNWEHMGEVDHSLPRSLAPELVYDTTNGLLLQKHLNRLRKVACVHAPEFRMFSYEGPDDRRLPQRFIWRDAHGTITKERIG